MAYHDFNPRRGGAYPGNIESRCLDVLIDLANKHGANPEAGTAAIAESIATSASLPCTTTEVRAALKRLESVELVLSKRYRGELLWLVTAKGRAAHEPI